MEKRSKRIIILLAGMCLWIFYVFQEEMARYALYTIFSFGTHELASGIPFLCIGVAAIWSGFLMVKVVKRQCDRSDKIFIVVLLAMMFWVGRHIYMENHRGVILDTVTVQSVDREKEEIVIRSSKGETFTLQSPEVINRMIKTDGQKYVITYDEHADSSGIRKLQTMALPNN